MNDLEFIHDYPRFPVVDETYRGTRNTHALTHFLAPKAGQSDVVRYSFGRACNEEQQLPHVLMTTPTRLDTLCTDTTGERSDFWQRSHGLIARMRNKQLDRDDHFWRREATDHQVPKYDSKNVDESLERLIETIVEICTLPVADDWVVSLDHWDGAKVLPSSWGEQITIERPNVFDRTTLPGLVTFVPLPPPLLLEHYSVAEARELVNARIDAKIRELNLQRRGKVVGRNGCEDLDPRGRRAGARPPERMREYCGPPAAVAAAEEEFREVRAFYASCREIFATVDQRVVFPRGTVRFRKLGANCDPHPPSCHARAGPP